MRIKIAILQMAMIISLFGLAQTKNQYVWNKLVSDAQVYEDPAQLLFNAKSLLDSFLIWRLPKDSVYVRLLDRIGFYYYKSSNDLPNAISYAARAIESGRKLNKGNSIIITAGAYRNLAYYYKLSQLYKNALSYFDTTIIVLKQIRGKEEIILDSREVRCGIFFKLGDYEKITEESTMALYECANYSQQKYFHVFYNTRAQAYNYQNDLLLAAQDADSALLNAGRMKDTFEVASALKTKAIIQFKKHNYSLADSLFQQVFQWREKTGDSWQLSDDYTDYGYFITDSLHQYHKAIDAHSAANKLALIIKDSSRMAITYNNIGVAWFKLNNFPEAFRYYRKAFLCLGVKTLSNDLSSLSAASLNKIYNKDLLSSLLGNYTEVLLHLYKASGDKKFLKGSLRVAIVTDSVISYLRHEQSGEQSKLYWRNKTREFYINSLEACYQSNDLKYAFYFMEKSRAVLLNDKLNELGAAFQLPADVKESEHRLRVNVVRLQQSLSTIRLGSSEYNATMNRLLNARNSLERFVRFIELKFPVYYQYKFSERTPSIFELQGWLKKNDQQLLEYFVTDTSLYCLVINKDTVQFDQIGSQLISKNELKWLAELNSNRSLLNQHYNEYLALSQKAYRALFGKFRIRNQRLIVCPDEIVFPMEALCINLSPVEFLLQRYSFSYTYSANFLMRNYFVRSSANNFLGYAPGDFTYNSKLPGLPGSVEALGKAGSYFTNSTIFTGNRASKFNFISSLPNYAVVNLYSHAIADINDNGPAIYMYDSLIRLSELGLIKNVSTQLIILSACETNAGKSFTGEGVYSMARGFSSIGIPSVAATLWKADEQAIYEITSFFNEQLSKGINKDEALRQAKLYYIKNHHGESQLPFYWANLILIGDAGPVLLSKESPVNKSMGIILGIIVILTIVVVVKNSSHLLS